MTSLDCDRWHQSGLGLAHELSTIIILLVGRRLLYLCSLGETYFCISKTFSAFAATNGAISGG